MSGGRQQVDLRRLRYFVALSEELQFSRAARRLDISQSTLSAAIGKLEAQVGCQLFARSTRRVELTPAGQGLLADARVALAAVDGSLAAVRRGPHHAPALRIGLTSPVRFGIIDALLDAFARARPDQEVTLREQASRGLLTGLDRYDLDVCLTCCEPARPSQHAVRLCEEPLLVALPADHPLAGQDLLDLRRLADVPLLLARGKDAAGLNAFLLAACHRAGLEPRTRSTHHVNVAATLARHRGFMLLPASAAVARSTGIAFARPARTIELPIDLVWRRADTAHATAAFVDVALAVADRAPWRGAPALAAAS
jgi:DNA-binding transcriptional LysR family regulator